MPKFLSQPRSRLLKLSKTLARLDLETNDEFKRLYDKITHKITEQLKDNFVDVFDLSKQVKSMKDMIKDA